MEKSVQVCQYVNEILTGKKRVFNEKCTDNHINFIGYNNQASVSCNVQTQKIHVVWYFLQHCENSGNEILTEKERVSKKKEKKEQITI